MKEGILSKYFFSSGSMVVTCGFHTGKEFLDQWKTTINFSRNVVYCGVGVWVNEIFRLRDKITDTYFHIMLLFVYVLYKEHIET
jgi:hypothetical protein